MAGGAGGRQSQVRRLRAVPRSGRADSRRLEFLPVGVYRKWWAQGTLHLRLVLLGRAVQGGVGAGDGFESRPVLLHSNPRRG